MERRNVHLFALLCVCFLPTVQAWSGNYCSRRVCSYVTRRVCAYRTWAGCCAWRTVREARYITQYFCCSGWRETVPGNQDCRKAICSPPCQNNAPCIRPNVCDCLVQNTGPRCDGVVCSHNAPCYPGTCVQDDSCDCSSGFTTVPITNKQDYCLKIENNTADIQIYQMRVRLSNYKPNMSPEMMLFEYNLDASNQTTDIFWSNRKNFNRLEANCSSQYFVPSMPPPPDYVKNSSFGIVSGGMHALLEKLPRAGQTQKFISYNETLPCTRTVSATRPETDLFECIMKNDQFDRNIEHGDILRVTFQTEGGGYRDVYDLNNNKLHRQQTYLSIARQLPVELHFDFMPPTYCAASSSCSGDETMLRVPDITQASPLRIEWKGWTDADSKVFRYAVEVFRLTKATEDELEIKDTDALKPLINQEVMHSTSDELYFYEYNLPGPGMYAVILEVADRANNTRFVRRLVLYDPDHPVATDPEHEFKFSSASPAWNYTWQSNVSAPVTVTWDGHFVNVFHEQNSLLGKVRGYPPSLKDREIPDSDFTKTIDRESVYDDHEGERTVDPIPNKRGIVKFQVAHNRDSAGGTVHGERPDATSPWQDVFLNTSFTYPESSNLNPNGGDTVVVWVKAIDATGKETIARRQLSFDPTEPTTDNFGFLMNNPVPGINFSSTFTLSAEDRQSGVAHVKWTFTRLNGTVIYNETVPGRTAQKNECEARSSECYCLGDGKTCFWKNQSFSFSNCKMVVEKNRLDTEKITVHADVTNSAGLVKRLEMIKGDLDKLSGTESYAPPQNVTVTSIGETKVTITWEYPISSCYVPDGFWVEVNGKKNGVYKDERQYVISDLEPGTSYTVYLSTSFVGGPPSERTSFSFETAEAAGLGGGAIAGICIGLLILIALIVLIVVFVLYRRRVILQEPGPVNKQLNRMSHAFDNVRRMTRKEPSGAFSNSAYRADEDEVYLYGHMAFQTRQNWQMSDQDLTLLDHIAEGKFANIYKATWRHDKRQDTVAAKMLKPGFSEDDALKMMAKINFFATQFEDHDNVIKFHGAVTDNNNWGPVMVMEYCENGQMDKWLVDHRKETGLQIMDNMLRFALGVAKGMEYLASKRIVHRRLAARNVLLTFILDPKVAGFGPQHKEGAEDRMTRVPAKWAAPEVLEERTPTEKSDVWSFGVVLWEIFSMGQVPYANIHAKEVGTRLKSGYRMEKPEFADDIHYEIMKDCWQYKQGKRPTFKTIRSRLEQHFSPGNRQSVDFYYDTNQLRDYP